MLGCVAGFVGGVAFGWMYELFAVIVFAPVLLIPVLVTSLIVSVFGRVHDPVEVGRPAALAGVASVALAVIVLYHVQMW